MSYIFSLLFRSIYDKSFSCGDPSMLMVTDVPLDLEGGKHFFNTVREGDSVLFATEDEQDAHNCVMAFYRATGQAHKPTPPVTTGKNSAVTKAQGGTERKIKSIYPGRS